MYSIVVTQLYSSFIHVFPETTFTVRAQGLCPRYNQYFRIFPTNRIDLDWITQVLIIRMQI